MIVSGQVPVATADQVSAIVFPGGIWFKGTYYPPIAGGAPDGDEPPAPVTPPVVVPPTLPVVAPPVVLGTDGEPFDAARAQRTITALRDELKALKPQAQAGQTAQQRLQELEDAQRTELERAQARADAQTAKAAALESQLAQSQAAHQQAIIRTAVEREAHQAGAVKADVVYRLADLSNVTIDDAGNVVGAKKAVETLLEAEPYLKAAAPTGTAATTAIPVTPRANGKPQTQAEMVEAASQRLAQSGRYGRL